MTEELKWRMYGFVPYNISEIQKGIQFGHGVVEYAQNYFDSEEYQKWANVDKTFIILNGGTSSTMLVNHQTLIDAGITTRSFCEPDLNNMLSAIVFLVDERVYDRENYPDFKTWMIRRNPNNKLMPKETIETLVSTFETAYDEWCEIIGGEKNVFLKNYLNNFRLA
jgi:hypothetical protein